MTEVIHRTAQFHNFTKQEFVGYWDGRSRKFKAGEKKWMPEYLARHFAKHLVNKVLIEKGQETLTSPKFPDQVPQFMELFEKAFFLQEEEEETDVAERTDVHGGINDIEEEPIKTAPARGRKGIKTVVDNKPPQIITPPGDDDDEAGDFQGSK